MPRDKHLSELYRLSGASPPLASLAGRSIAGSTDASASQRKWSRERWRRYCTTSSPPSTESSAFPRGIIFWYSLCLTPNLTAVKCEQVKIPDCHPCFRYTRSSTNTGATVSLRTKSAGFLCVICTKSKSLTLMKRKGYSFPQLASLGKKLEICLLRRVRLLLTHELLEEM